MLMLFDEKENLAFLTAKSSGINNKPAGNQHFPELSFSGREEEEQIQGLGDIFGF